MQHIWHHMYIFIVIYTNLIYASVKIVTIVSHCIEGRPNVIKSGGFFLNTLRISCVKNRGSASNSS